MGFLGQSHYDIVLAQETKLRVNSEYVTPNWICVGSGTDTQKHAGVMILVRKTITNVQEVRHDTIIPGRLLRVRFPLGKDSCKLSVICAYQHAWNPKDPNIFAKREAFWHKLSHCIGGIPYREHVVIGGDLNVQLTPLLPYVGHGTGALSPERAPDADAAHTIASTHSLVALTTWGTPGSKAHTFVFGKHQAQLDYALVRQRHADGPARSARPAKNCPVGGWRQGGGMHSPIIASLPFHCKVFHKPPTHTPSIDAERIAQLAQASDKHDDPQVKQFRQAVKERIASVSTMLGVGQISLMVSEVARQHFPKAKEKTDTIVRWQQSPVKQGIKEMRRAWRMYRYSTSNATLEAIFGRWSSWTSYYQLYKRHKERCRTALRSKPPAATTNASSLTCPQVQKGTTSAARPPGANVDSQ